MAITNGFSVLILTGAPQLEYVKTVGPFDGPDDALRWIEEQDYGTKPGVKDWAVVVPWEQP